MTRHLAAAFALTCVVFSAPTPVGACDCMVDRSTPCVAAWAVDAVFVAQVVDRSRVESTLPEPPFRWLETRNRMQVSEAFRGDVGAEVDVYTDASTSCGFGFESGVSYVVYARRGPDGRLTTGACSRTHKADTDPEDLAYLRAMVLSAPTPASIVGQAGITFVNAPLQGMRVIAESDGARYEAETGRDGQYTLPVPLGSYRVTYAVGEGLQSSEARVDVAHERSCVVANVTVLPDGRLTGRVVDTAGTPVANMSVFLANAQPGAVTPATTHKAVTDADGVYRLALVEPGLYLVGTGVVSYDLSDKLRVFHPGVVDRAKSTRVALELGERKKLPDLVVPADVDLLTVIGTVRSASGAPVAGATVSLHETYRSRSSTGPITRAAAESVTTDSEGRFTISAVAGRYSFYAYTAVPEQNRRRIATTDPFDGAGRVDVDLTLPD